MLVLTSVASLVFSAAPYYQEHNPRGSFSTRIETQEKVVCGDCSPNEKVILKEFQEEGVTDKKALAAILGNIKQESRFEPRVCEGGFLSDYNSCEGGFGLIQFTEKSRYKGLGEFSLRIGDSPSSLKAQLRYIFQEPQWRSVKQEMTRSGGSLDSYMSSTYQWIGWGVEGKRRQYSKEYLNRLDSKKVEILHVCLSTGSSNPEIPTCGKFVLGGIQ